jgi:Skp family chaperone for outer membrane proteins
VTKNTPPTWKIYGMTALIALGVGGLAGRHAPTVPEAHAEGILWAAPGAVARMQQPDASPYGPRTMKFAFVNSQAVFDLHPRVPELRTAYEAQIRQWQQEETSIQANAETLQNDLRTAQLSPNQRRSKEAELTEALSELARYQSEIWAAGGRAQQKEQELMQPIITAIDQVIKDLAENEEFDLIFDAGGGGLLFGHKDLDLTKTVLEKLGIPIPGEDPPPGANRP